MTHRCLKDSGHEHGGQAPRGQVLSTQASAVSSDPGWHQRLLGSDGGTELRWAGSPDGHILKPELQVGGGGQLVGMKSEELGQRKEKLLSGRATGSPSQEGALGPLCLVTGQVLSSAWSLESQVECGPDRGWGPAGGGHTSGPAGRVGDPTSGELPHLGCWPHRKGSGTCMW